MKIITIATILFFSFFGFTQESYDFATALPPEENTTLTVAASSFGTYEAENNESYYEFNASGVWIVSTIFSSISRETIRESSKYVVRNGYIFGVILDDSLPCELEGERYHFGMRNREQIIGPNSLNVLKKVSSSSYILNFHENGGYTPSLFTFAGKSLTVQHFDYDTGTTLFENIEDHENKETNGMNYITLSPTGKEWGKLDKAKIFTLPTTYKLTN